LLEISLIQKEIEAMKKKVDEIDKFNIDNQQSKQERFYYKCFIYFGKTMWQIVDSKKEIDIPSLLNHDDIAIDICKALNAMEASK
jgi:hypothetical protein